VQDVDAYADFADVIEEAARGSFRAPADGAWTAERIVAHLALTNERLIATIEALLAGHEVDGVDGTHGVDGGDGGDWGDGYEAGVGREAVAVRELDAYAASYGGLRGLADRLAETVVVLRDLAGQLGSRGQDAPARRARVLDQLATRRARAHLDQLRALRSPG
jgi:hypothetical protein